MIPCQQLLTNEFLSGLQLNLSIRDVVNSCFISTRIKEVPYEPQLDVVACVVKICFNKSLVSVISVYWLAPARPWSMLQSRGLQLNLSIRDVVNRCFISPEIKEVPHEPLVDVVLCVVNICFNKSLVSVIHCVWPDIG